jgi:signal transduction histidine kinase
MPDLVQLNRLKDEFLACISHELKTPLTAVLGLSRLLVDRQLGELNERQARYAGLIHQSGRHLMSVVNDILDLTRMETGQMELTLTPAKIRAVCDRAALEAKAIHTQNSKTPVNVQPQAPRSPDHQFTLSIEPGLDQISPMNYACGKCWYICFPTLSNSPKQVEKLGCGSVVGKAGLLLQSGTQV